MHQWRKTIHADCMREVHRTYDAHQDETIANDELLEVTWPRVIDRMTAISDQPYALCFRCDGSIAIKQHGIINVLPNVDPPRGPKPQAESISAYRLALSLRCRLWGCFRGLCLLEHASKDAFVGHSYRRFAQQFGYKCPMKDVSEEQLGSLSDRLPESIRRFLCNNQCPVNCCTTDCPWHDHEFELGASQDVLYRTRLHQVISCIQGSASQSLTARLLNRRDFSLSVSIPGVPPFGLELAMLVSWIELIAL